MLALLMIGKPAFARHFHFYTYSQSNAKMATPLLRRAYRKLGHSISIEQMPSLRGLAAANKGHSDGEFIRIAGLSQRFQNLIQVPVAILHLDTVIVTASDSNLAIKDWSDLAAVRFGSMRGMQLAFVRTHGLKHVLVDDEAGLLEMVVRGRLDAAVFHMSTVQKYPEALKKLRIIQPPLENTALYHYVHQRHREIVPKLVTVLNDMYIFRAFSSSAAMISPN